MAKIRFVDRATRTYDEYGHIGLFIHHAGSDEEPELFEIRLPPDTKVEAHAHESDEILLVADGEVRFGKQRYGVGSSVFIPKMTLYSFQAGPDGLTFMNFRPRSSPGKITAEEFMSLRKGETAPS